MDLLFLSIFLPTLNRTQYQLLSSPRDDSSYLQHFYDTIALPMPELDEGNTP